MTVTIAIAIARNTGSLLAVSGEKEWEEVVEVEVKMEGFCEND